MLLQRAIEHASRDSLQLGVIFLDLDRFKDINDTLGHEAGDIVLKYAAQQINQCLRKEDTLARLGGDEFIVLIEGIQNTLDLQKIAEKILDKLTKPIQLDENLYRISASIGISIFPDDGSDPKVLMKNADAAMYEAKAHGRECFIFYKRELTRAVEERIAITSDLRAALDRDELILHYQPQYCTKSGRLIAAEALVRWEHPDKGLIPPNEFISVAEETGLISKLGDWVLQSACTQFKEWLHQGLANFSLAINLSVKQLQPGYARHLKQLLAASEFPIEYLELEITESLLMEREGDPLAELYQLQELGVGIAMDDFGTGHSSLAQLKNLPISKLKIDRSFVRDLPCDHNSVVIARTIIAMGHSLNLKVVAEGVETKEQQNFLQKEGCDLLQGYLLCHPLSAASYEQLLTAVESQ
jgi:diguanylate cyclase (GGDEF)-like protein